VAAVLTIFIFAINVALSRPLIDALLFSLAIAVGIAPEMMPAIVTVSLSAGSKALAAKKVLVKRLVAIEDLGNIEILFTDKTGTLTEGAITFERALGPDGGVSGRALLLGLLCNEAAVTETGAVGGNALDQALWSAPGAALAGAGAYGRLGVLPFDHERQLASVLVREPGGGRLLITKGAPEVVLDRCAGIPAGTRPALDALFRQGARVVAVASRAAAYAGLRRGGRLVLVALPAAGKLTIPVFDTVLNGVSVIGSIVGTRADLLDVFALHAAGRTRVIYETRPLAAVNESIQEVLHGKAKARIVMAPS
jgi:P-type Mg2+ transporter